MMPGAAVPNGEFEKWEKERKALQAKLDALQDALNVDLGSLDWDGTLDDAEAKMKALVPALCSDNDAVVGLSILLRTPSLTKYRHERPKRNSINGTRYTL